MPLKTFSSSFILRSEASSRRGIILSIGNASFHAVAKTSKAICSMGPFSVEPGDVFGFIYGHPEKGLRVLGVIQVPHAFFAVEEHHTDYLAFLRAELSVKGFSHCAAIEGSSMISFGEGFLFRNPWRSFSRIYRQASLEGVLSWLCAFLFRRVPRAARLWRVR